VNELLAGIVIAVAEFAALFGLVALLGRESGIQINLIVGAGAGFFIVGLQRIVLSVAIVVLCLVLHVAAWFLFPVGIIPVDHSFLAQLYISSAVTTFALSAMIAYYAFRLAERAEAETKALLRNILPDKIVDRLRDRPTADRGCLRRALFCSPISKLCAAVAGLGATRTVALSRLMRRFDAWRSNTVRKIKRSATPMAVAVCELQVTDHAERVAVWRSPCCRRTRSAHFGVVFRCVSASRPGRSWPG
jgi:adenylate cyclase